ncbi:peroxisomal targeting signal 1 receptor isoform X1 [Ischnura elegans]|uniref:peroxisomal targeting signal 1 receptor isoform X1 n=1 Tax=Ischnura elegans TaxID=197161 RepID=UPI001ED8889E|nr:peroxisomal targeting signal 1 receptor isoform X1 [Ischnura elegans]
MALRDLVEPECGGASALVRLTSHFVQDRALKDEGLSHQFPQGDSFANATSDQLVQEFLEGTLGGAAEATHPPQTFRMDSLLEEMREIELARHRADRGGPGDIVKPGPGVAAVALAEAAEGNGSELTLSDIKDDDKCWADQYIESGKHFDEDPKEDAIWADEFQNSISKNPQEEVFELGFGPKWAQDYLESAEHSLDVDIYASEWVEDFKNSTAQKNEIDVDGIKASAQDIVKAVEDDPKFTYSKFMKFMKKVGDGEITIESGQVVGAEEEVEGEAKTGINPIRNIEAVADVWASEFAQEQKKTPAEVWAEEFKNSEPIETSADEPVKEDNSYDKEFWRNLQEEWEKLAKGQEGEDNSWVSEFSEYYDSFKDYTFEKENPLSSVEDPLEEGKKKLLQGDLPSAVLLFEAACQKQPENPLAWQLLGTTQAENEQDPLAIAALKKCLLLEPGNLTALMALAVSYTNESYQNQACHALKEWIKNNPKYSDLISGDAVSTSPKLGNITSLLTKGIHKEVQDLYIEAARRNPMDTIDPDVQCGLGVLFNLSNEYDKAVDCFKAALQVREDDFRLWNRLGATLANGNRSEEAVDAYHNALQLSPGFIRARYNLGITCIHLHAFQEAAEHFLTALNLQAAGRGVGGSKSWSSMSDGIWSSLRLVVSLNHRPDLYSAVDNRDLAKLNKEFGIE